MNRIIRKVIGVSILLSILYASFLVCAIKISKDFHISLLCIHVYLFLFLFIVALIVFASWLMSDRNLDE